MRRLRFALAALAAIFTAAIPAVAATIPSFTGSQYSEPSQILATINALINQLNTSLSPITGSTALCSGTTTATCQGNRFTVSITGLTTAAAGTSSAAMVVTNASVTSVAATVLCNVNIYAGGGMPIATAIIPATGSVSLKVTNVAASGALDATVPVACVVYN